MLSIKAARPKLPKRKISYSSGTEKLLEIMKTSVDGGWKVGCKNPFLQRTSRFSDKKDLLLDGHLLLRYFFSAECGDVERVKGFFFPFEQIAMFSVEDGIDGGVLGFITVGV
ncbi:hypothetical protein CDAR_60251 [Caerostris darwini]|uniref:Uncharacterized protein n=1 Tax=Caerostris darwini TaxID=1538125 RepID=A0AAV4QK17_9ARAC|nr:hypothetical protein CDAR_60251 [Caerostris darwini]